MNDVRERGAQLRGELGLPHRFGLPAGIQQDYQSFIDRYVFGETWGRDEIDLRTRSIVTVSMLMDQGRNEQLALHLGPAISNGLSPDELRAIGAVYCGVPAVSAAFAVAAEVFDVQLHDHE